MQQFFRLHPFLCFLAFVLSAHLGNAQSGEGPPCVVDIANDGSATIAIGADIIVFRHVLPQGYASGHKALRGTFLSTGEKTFSDELGSGKEYEVVFENLTWNIRTYLGKPFLTTQVTYRNTSPESVEVRLLHPWRTAGGCSLGPGTNRSPILDNGTLLQPRAQLHFADTPDVISMWNLGIYNPLTERSLIAGFLTNRQAYTHVAVFRAEDPDEDTFESFYAECGYALPIPVPPGGELASEPLYLSLGEDSPLEGLERFASAVAEVNKLAPARRALPHGWDSWVAHYHNEISERQMLAELDVADRELKRYGWTHFSLDDGWQRKAGAWEADPERFPSGMKAFADAVHARGMTAGIWTEPFTVHVEAPVARAHPEWLLQPNLMGAALLGNDERILDVTVPDTFAYLRDVYRTVAVDWGYDALVETDFLYHLLGADRYGARNATQVEALNAGMRAIRQGAGPETFIMGVAPFGVVGMTADGMRTGIDCAPIWRTSEKTWSWGCADTLPNAARRYYLAPDVITLDQDCAFFGHGETRRRWKVEDFPPLTRNQQIAWLTGAALTGGAVKLGDAFTLMTPDQFDILRRLLPVADRPARPIDLFKHREARVWTLPITCAIGRWNIVAIFNWDLDAPVTESLSLVDLGLDSDTTYAAFDFWANTYTGSFRNTMDVMVPPTSVRLFSLRPKQDHPIFLATDSHLFQGAKDFTALAWDSETQVLSGAFDAVARTDYVLSFLVPQEYTLQSSSFGDRDVRATEDNSVHQFSFRCEEQGPVTWRLQFLAR